MDLPVSTITLSAGLALLLIGMWGMLTQKNIIRMIIGFSLIDTGVHMIMVSIGYLSGGTAPIINAAVDRATALQTVVDPVPSALVLTAIVIGLGITAVMLAFAVQIHDKKKSLSIEDCTESKW
ncbi:MAG: cation:proton antiporter subunit C [Pseudomonadota bacterium]